MSAQIYVHRFAIDVAHRSGCVDRELHAVLARYLERAPVIVLDEKGKPRLAEDALAFNVSHSGTIALIAVSIEGPIGVDVEQHRVIPDIASLARRYFTPREASLVDDDGREFFRLWARKEAWIKAQGGGLAIPLDSVDLSGDTPGWFIEDLSIAPGYSAAIARPGSPAEIRIVDEPGRASSA